MAVEEGDTAWLSMLIDTMEEIFASGMRAVPWTGRAGRTFAPNLGRPASCPYAAPYSLRH